LNSRREFFRPRSFIFQARFRRLDHGMSRNVIVINDIKRTMNPVSKFMPVTSPYAVRVGTVDDLNQIAGIRASSFFTEGEVSEDSYVYKQWKQEFLDVTSERIKSSKILILVAQTCLHTSFIACNTSTSHRLLLSSGNRIDRQ